MGGRRIVPIRTLANTPFSSLGRIHRPASFRTRRSPLFATCWRRSAIPARNAGPTASRPSSALRGLASPIDLPAHERDGLLIDRGGVPGLDGCKVRFSRLVARAGAPAMGLQQICRRTERVGSSVKIAGAVGQDVLGHELGLAY